MSSAIIDPIEELLTSYNELNSPHITILSDPPSALEFLQFVAQNRPFVVHGGASDWPAVSEWNVSSLKDIMKGREVNVAVTPKGNADAPTTLPSGEIVFVKPHEEMQDFSSFIDFVSQQELSGDAGPRNEIRYAQTQNNNLHTEYSPLLPSLPPSISFARLALSQPQPDATNFWLGNSHSTTSLHKDPYQNVYIQITGSKLFTLFPPICVFSVQETLLRSATYSSDLSIVLDTCEGSEQDGSDEKIPVAMYDPDAVGKNGKKGKYAGLVTPMRVRLEKGDMLYLPALWYHKVAQECDEEGICVAVNYWYDMDFSGSFWPLCNFARNVAVQKAAEGQL